MTEYKNNHYVPQMLLKRFKDANGVLYYYNKNTQLKGVEPRNTKTIFSECHLYTERDKNGKADVSLERDVYGKIDSDANDVIDKIVAASRSNCLPCLTLTEKASWDIFLYHQWKRTPDFHDRFVRPAESTFANRFVQALEGARGGLSDEKKQQIEELVSDRVNDKTFVQNAKVKALKTSGSDVIDALSSRGLGVALIRKLNRSFIIGSFPIIKLTPAGMTHIGHSSVEIWIPIAHDVVVGPHGGPNEEKIVNISDSHVRALNEFTFRQSTEVAGRSKKLIE